MSKIMKLYRTMNRLSRQGKAKRAHLLSRWIRFIFSCEIPPTVLLEEGVELHHGGLGCVIHDNCIVGAGTKIYQNVTLGGGNRNKDGRNYPIVGKDVFIGAGALLFGGITIGDNAKIGGGAVVITDVPENATAVGVPAKIYMNGEEI